MQVDSQNLSLFPTATAPTPSRDKDRRALDELFDLARKYKSTKNYWELLQFIARFRFYSPFNAMLIHMQMSGAKYVAPPGRWLHKYQRRIKPNARAIVILQPMGAVLFVFDVSDTEPEKDAPALPREITDPFPLQGGEIGGQLNQTIENAKRDGVRVSHRKAASQSAGEIRTTRPGAYVDFVTRKEPPPEIIKVQVRYELLLNQDHEREVQYATLGHELAHLYCGHLGTPNPRWWKERQGLPLNIREFEAESVSYLVCRRLGIDNSSEQYLAGYLEKNSEVPPISLDCVMAASGLIEQMGRERLKPRKENKHE
jgi:hypothetical protein